MGVFAGLLAVAWGLGGCGGGGAERVRRHTYPTDFRYVTDDELQASMVRLASALSELDRLLARDPSVEEVPRQRVAALLTEMENAARSLGAEALPSNHPRLGMHLGELRTTIERARRDVQRDPPRYYRAGVLSGACLVCHGPDR